ncbi:MAG: hypothetical protein U0R44_02310 [Candidatus Micrarchaeia archaeon]
MEIEERIQQKIDALMQYRSSLDDGERELFDILIGYANEVAMTIDASGKSAVF